MIVCEDPTPLQTPQFEWVQCYASGELISPISVTSTQPVSIVYDTTCTDCIIEVGLSGYNGAPDVCLQPFGSGLNKVRINPCAGHYPHQNLYPNYYGWWGYFVDDSNTKRINAAIDAAENYGGARSRGVRMVGTSYGGTGAIMQSMVLDDVTVVHASVPFTLFVQDFPAQATLAWEGQNYDVLDFRLNADPNTFYRIHGSPVDTAVVFNLDIFDECRNQQLACWGTWHDQGHNPWLAGMPLYYLDTFPGPDSRVQVGKPLVAFTNSSANQSGPVGHYNLGLEWNVHTMDGENIPLRYRAQQGQPSSAVFDVTVRGVTVIERYATWEFGSQRGIVEVTNGTATITGLSRISSDNYQVLELRGIPGC